MFVGNVEVVARLDVEILEMVPLFVAFVGLPNRRYSGYDEIKSLETCNARDNL